MSDKIELVLADCIDEIREGRMTVEECLERYPQLRQELSILLGTWQEISTAPQVTPSVEFQRTAKTRLQNRMLS